MSRQVTQHYEQGYCTKVAEIPALERSWMRWFVLNKTYRLFVEVFARAPYWNEVTPNLIEDSQLRDEMVVRKVSARDNQFSKSEPGWMSSKRLWSAFSQMVDSKIRVRQSAPREILEVFTLASINSSPLLNQYRETETDLEANRFIPKNHQHTSTIAKKKHSESPTPATASSTKARKPNWYKASQHIAKVGEQHPSRVEGWTPRAKHDIDGQMVGSIPKAESLWVAHYGDIVSSRVRTCEQLGLHSSEPPHKIGGSESVYVAGIQQTPQKTITPWGKTKCFLHRQSQASQAELISFGQLTREEGFVRVMGVDGASRTSSFKGTGQAQYVVEAYSPV